jgi:N-acetylglutamate synthase-like GNAT family acetyltransferase
VEYHVRSARLTDVDAAIRILMRDPASTAEQRDDADRLRNLLFVPAATVVVAEADRRVIGVGVLSIRPSVRSGPFIGVIDELGVETAAERHESVARAADAALRRGVGASIAEHLVVSARNKGCTRVDVTDPLASAEPALLKRAGFVRRGALLSRAIG